MKPRETGSFDPSDTQKKPTREELLQRRTTYLKAMEEVHPVRERLSDYGARITDGGYRLGDHGQFTVSIEHGADVVFDLREDGTWMASWEVDGVAQQREQLGDVEKWIATILDQASAASKLRHMAEVLAVAFNLPSDKPYAEILRTYDEQNGYVGVRFAGGFVECHESRGGWDVTVNTKDESTEYRVQTARGLMDLINGLGITSSDK